MEMALLEPCDFEPERVRNPKHEEMEDNENDERDKVHLGCISELCEVMPTPRKMALLSQIHSVSNRVRK